MKPKSLPLNQSGYCTASRLAAFLRHFLLVAALVIAVLVLITAWWSPFGSALVCIGIICVPGLLGVPSFLQMARANRSDKAGSATWGDLLRAWWTETVTAMKVYLWWQSFGVDGLPDNCEQNHYSEPPVIFIHGFVCNRGLWRPWMQQLHQQGRAYLSVNLEPLFGSISDYAPIIEQAVRQAEAIGCGKPILVCHSMGGLAARNWLVTDATAYDRISKVVTIGSPHFGTLIAKGSRATNGREMIVGSRWLERLALREKQLRPENTYDKFLCWYSNTDNIVFPASTALLEGADNRLIKAIGHLALNFDPTVMRESLNVRAV